MNHYPLVLLINKPANLHAWFAQKAWHDLQSCFDNDMNLDLFTTCLLAFTLSSETLVPHLEVSSWVLAWAVGVPAGCFPCPTALAIAKLSIMLLLTNTPLLFVAIINEQSMRACCWQKLSWRPLVCLSVQTVSMCAHWHLPTTVNSMKPWCFWQRYASRAAFSKEYLNQTHLELLFVLSLIFLTWNLMVC